ncbi:hypothetical protein DYI69_19560 [Salmonella enterica]|nr:hypothetical protein [Salmonella enterica]
MFFNKKARDNVDVFRCDIIHEIERLQKLENGVKHYSGGIYSLHDRVNTTLSGNNLNNEEILLLLKDVSAYLRDLIVVGQLEKDSFPHSDLMINDRATAPEVSK